MRGHNITNITPQKKFKIAIPRNASNGFGLKHGTCEVCKKVSLMINHVSLYLMNVSDMFEVGLVRRSIRRCPTNC